MELDVFLRDEALVRPISPLYLPYISTISPLFLPYISPISHVFLRDEPLVPEGLEAPYVEVAWGDTGEIWGRYREDIGEI